MLFKLGLFWYVVLFTCDGFDLIFVAVEVGLFCGFCCFGCSFVMFTCFWVIWGLIWVWVLGWC